MSAYAIYSLYLTAEDMFEEAIRKPIQKTAAALIRSTGGDIGVFSEFLDAETITLTIVNMWENLDG